MRLSGYEEISCFKFNSVSYNQKKPKGTTYIHVNLINQTKVLLRRKMCTSWFHFTKKKTKKKLFDRGNG